MAFLSSKFQPGKYTYLQNMTTITNQWAAALANAPNKKTETAQVHAENRHHRQGSKYGVSANGNSNATGNGYTSINNFNRAQLIQVTNSKFKYLESQAANHKNVTFYSKSSEQQQPWTRARKKPEEKQKIDFLKEVSK